jgi:hypothetical protein
MKIGFQSSNECSIMYIPSREREREREGERCTSVRTDGESSPLALM